MMLSRARADIERSISIAPTGSAYVWMAKLSIDPANPGDHKLARSYLEKARSISSQDLQALMRASFTYCELRMFDASVECLDAALKLHPGDWNILRFRAQSTMRAGHYKDALAGADFLLKALPPTKKMEAIKKKKETSSEVVHYRIHADCCEVRALSLTALHLYADALPALNIALEITPDDNELLKARAEVYRHFGKTSLADADLRKTKKNTDFFFDNAPFSSDRY
jgi:tetratricopeptide (TPR) repeat protein